MTTRERLYLYDTTLRDGQQTQGVQFSTDEKHQIAQALDTLGIDYIEGGWPGANPIDSAFFDTAPKTRAKMTAFGMTKRAGRSAENDDVLAAVMNAGTDTVCLVGKSNIFHVTEALGITPEENLDNIRASIAHIVGQGREALFDAEHFFDGYAVDPGYATACLDAALDAGARWLVLCDTNGGTMPAQIGTVVADLIAGNADHKGFPGTHLGIHTHNDTEQAVAGSLAAVDAARALTIANQNACMGCHAVDRKLVGPAYKDVAAKYKGDAGAEAKLIKKVREGGMGNWGQIPMPANPKIADADLKTVIDWVLAGAPAK